MANLTQDVTIVGLGDLGDANQPNNLNLKAATTVYRGSIALTRSGVAVAAQNSGLSSATDIVWGLYEKAGPGTTNFWGPGITGGSVDGAVTVEVRTGTFFLASSTGGGALGPTTLGKTVYVYDEVTVTATSGGPIAGVHMYTDTTRTDAPGPYAIKLGGNESSGSP